MSEDWPKLRQRLRAEKQRLEQDPKAQFTRKLMLENLGRVCKCPRNPNEDDNMYFMRIKQTPEFGAIQDEMWDVRLGDLAVVDFMKELKKL